MAHDHKVWAEFYDSISHLPAGEQRGMAEQFTKLSPDAAKHYVGIQNNKLLNTREIARSIFNEQQSDKIAQAKKVSNGVRTVRQVADQARSKSAATNIATKYEQMKNPSVRTNSQALNQYANKNGISTGSVAQEFSQPNFAPQENPAIYDRSSMAERLGNRAADVKRTVRQMPSAAREFGEMIPEAGNLLGGGRGVELGDAAITGLGRVATSRLVTRALPGILDLLMPSKYGVSNGEISGGDMYPQQNGLYVNAAGGPLPQSLQSRNNQELVNRTKENAMFQQRDIESRRALGNQNYAANFTPTVVAPYQTNISRYIGNQQSDEPQSIAHQLAGQDSDEPVSIAKQLSMQDADVQSPRIQPPQSLYEHYLKIYGNPDKARAAINGNYK